jgi:hypothetical protein
MKTMTRILIILGIIGFMMTACDLGGTNPTVTDVTINQPTSKVETVGGGTFYGSGSTFTVTVQGENNPSQSVTWTRSGTDLNSGTTITGGVLTVHTDDHGKEIVITATSTVDTTKSNNVTVTVVTVLPSEFVGDWIGETLPNVLATHELTSVDLFNNYISIRIFEYGQGKEKGEGIQGSYI